LFSSSLSSLLQAAAWFAVILFLLAVAIAGVRKWRDGANQGEPTANELLTKFGELHDRGGLSDDEYRTIRTKLARQLETEVNNNDEKS
jgi:hypothetical protein